MAQIIDNAVGELIKRQQGTVTYTDNGKEVVVISKPAHYSAHIQLIDKEARKQKKSSVRWDKTYTYPKEIESTILWDMLSEMRKAIIAHTGEKGIEAWNNTFGKARPAYRINSPKSVWGDRAYINGYASGYHQAERKYRKSDEHKVKE